MAVALAFEVLGEADIEALLKQGKQTDMDKRRFLCAACGRFITTMSHRICRSGAHQHEFSNPFGMVFTIGCFAAAPGCTEIGAATYQHTWFPGFQWRIALCRSCRTHLGWEFQASDKGFFGLILDRLTLTT